MVVKGSSCLPTSKVKILANTLPMIRKKTFSHTEIEHLLAEISRCNFLFIVKQSSGLFLACKNFVYSFMNVDPVTLDTDGFAYLKKSNQFIECTMSIPYE